MTEVTGTFSSLGVYPSRSGETRGRAYNSRILVVELGLSLRDSLLVGHRLTL